MFVYALTFAAPMAVDAEVGNTSNTQADEFALSVTTVFAEIGSTIPMVVAVALIVFVLVRGI
ncbi:hypothetical protein GQS65_01360 [Halomarina oriensis]|uniref:Uncharacterized protein n=1 Tax=Halomarina oriensis TaxID=671145 RepID=A0A6B0GNI3_9EURY|nr:hypothetical protein [Halomarina oriensis]